MNVLGQETQFFYSLTPDNILDEIETLGLIPTGRCLALNSLENRVIEIELEVPFQDKIKSVVAKFYRPGRWSKDCIAEDHHFSQKLNDVGLNVIRPLEIKGSTIFQTKNSIFWSLYPKIKGQLVDEPSEDQLRILGLNIAKMHEVGSQFKSHYRPELSVANYGVTGLNNLAAFDLVPPSFRNSVVFEGQKLLNKISKILESENDSQANFESLTQSKFTIHGDLHYGNIIWQDGLPHITDFDDMMIGPPVQDIWMLTNLGTEDENLKREILLEGYEDFRAFPRSTLKWAQALKNLRYVHYIGWVAKRYVDPIFKQTFSHFENQSFWESIIIDFQNMSYKLDAFVSEDY